MRNDYDELIDAINEYDIPAIHRLLQCSGTFTAKEIYSLCGYAMSMQCETDTILEIIKYGPSVEELIACDPGISLIPGQGSGFPELLVSYDRSDILRYLLERGFIPVRRHEDWSSMLEIALHYNAPRCLRELLRCPQLDTDVTEQMRCSWGRLGMDIPRGFSALREVAGALFALDPQKLTSIDDIPLLPGMTVMHAAQHHNWALLGRMCKAHGITEAQCNEILENFETHYWEKALIHSFKEADALQDAAEMLDTLFTACPSLLQSDYPRSMLVICMLQMNDETSTILAPLRQWWEQISSSEIVLETIGRGPWAQLLTDGMQGWDEMIGTRFTPVLHRSNPMPFTKTFWRKTDDIIRDILPKCRISGSVPNQGLSPLAQSLIARCPNSRSDEVNAVLALENPDAVRSCRKQTLARIAELQQELSQYE